MIHIKKTIQGLFPKAYQFYLQLCNEKQAGFPSLQPYGRALIRWNRCNGDENLRTQYNLNADSVVFDMGGYVGDWTAAIVNQFHCTSYVFEPVKEYCDKIAARFADNPNVLPFAFGLEGMPSKESIIISEDASSLYADSSAQNGTSEEVRFERATTFIQSHKIASIDVMKINIEGGEYALLEDLLASGMVERIQNFQIQFHNIPSVQSKKRMRQIQRKLKKTHDLTWAFRPYVWENWAKRT